MNLDGRRLKLLRIIHEKEIIFLLFKINLLIIIIIINSHDSRFSEEGWHYYKFTFILLIIYS